MRRREKEALSRIRKVLLVMSLVTLTMSGNTYTAYGYTNSTDIDVTDTFNATGIIRPAEDVNNSGNIRATATGVPGGNGSALGIVSGGPVMNSGNISTTASADVAAESHGIEGGPLGGVTNSGAINSTAIGSSSANVYGIDSVSTGVVTNTGTITATANSGAGGARAYAIYTPNSSVNNTGTLAVTASGLLNTTAYGILSPAASTALTNTGDISVMVRSSAADAFAHGIYTSSPAIQNAGTIRVTAIGDGNAETEGIFAGGASGILGNSGFIAANAISSTANASAYGIRSPSGAALLNSGAVAATAGGADNAEAYGISSESASAVYNTGAVGGMATSGTGDATAFGIRAINGGIYNSGNITAVAASSSHDALATGLSSVGSTPLFYNTGNITADASGVNADATGIVVGFGPAVLNSGAINATANGTGNACAGGILSIAPTGIIANIGSINASATGPVARAFGIHIDPPGAVDNAGAITVTASGPDSAAYGIVFNAPGTLTNTGTIHAGAGNAYEVYAAAPVTLLNRYNMTFDGNPARGSIYVNSLFDINSSLISASVAPDTRFNTQYRIFDGPGAVIGNFGDTHNQNPAVSLLYHDQGSASAADDTVSLSYQPQTSPVLQGSDVNRRVVTTTLDIVRQQQVNTFLLHNSTFGRLAQAGNVATDAPARLLKAIPRDTVYLTPYYADLKNSSSDLGYHSRLAGFAAGYDRTYDRYQAGFHIGYGHAKIDFDGTNFPVSTDEDQDILTLGLQGMARWENWTLRGDVTGFYGWHDYRGATGSNFEATESAKYNSYGTTESVLAGYIFKKGKNILFPEMGFNHIWLHQDSFSTDATLGGWSTDYSSMNNNLIQAVGSLRWLYSFSIKEYPSLFTLGAGGRYRMNNDNLTLQQTVPGSQPTAVVVNQNRGAATALASFIINNGNFSTEIAYNGEYSSDVRMHGGWLKFRWGF